jgi:hypothetical protein
MGATQGSHSHLGVADWWASFGEHDVFLSVMTLGEIRGRIESVRHRDPVKAAALERWLRDVVNAFGALIIGVDPAVADAWERMLAAPSVPVGSTTTTPTIRTLVSAIDLRCLRRSVRHASRSNPLRSACVQHGGICFDSLAFKSDRRCGAGHGVSS